MKKALVLRFLRTYLPQVPAVIAYIMPYLTELQIPAWVAPTLSLVGALCTVLDKFMRELGLYEEIKEAILTK